MLDVTATENRVYGGDGASVSEARRLPLSSKIPDLCTRFLVSEYIVNDIVRTIDIVMRGKGRPRHNL